MKVIKNIAILHEAQEEYNCGPIEAIYNVIYDLYSNEYPDEYFLEGLNNCSEDELIDTFNAFFGEWPN